MRTHINRHLCGWASGLAFTAIVAFAQNSVPGRFYDPSTETTLKGTVQEVTQGPAGGTHLVVKVGEETKQIVLGPPAFLASRGFAFAKDDTIAATGSKVTVNGKEYIIAREIVKDGKTLTLRDKAGKPQWAGRGKRRRSG
jgi:hypothetical protein